MLNIKLFFCYLIYAMALPLIMVLEKLNWFNRVEFCLQLIFFKHQELVRIFYAQSSHETGYFRSNLYQRWSNCFGMGWCGTSSSLWIKQTVRKTPCTQRGVVTADGNREVASYFNTMQAVFDFALWIKYRSGIVIPKSLKKDLEGNSVTVLLEAYSLILKGVKYYEDDQYKYNNALVAHYSKLPNSRNYFFVCIAFAVLSLWLYAKAIKKVFFTKRRKKIKIAYG